jgi:DNA-binding IclR family transcriptional regulator
MKNESDENKSVTGRAFSVLDTFDATHRHQKLANIARRSGLPLTTAHRLVAELASQGALTRTADGTYEIGTKIWRLGILASLHSDLREIALPYMEDIYELGNDAVQIGVLDGFRCLIVERIAGSRTLSVISKPGARLPLHASGVGKILLAYGTRELQQAALVSLDKFTGKTITDADVLQRQLKLIKLQAYAHSQEELTLGATSLAVPIFGSGNRVIAALGIVTPVENKDIVRMVSVLKVSAQALSKKLILNGLSESSLRV